MYVSYIYIYVLFIYIYMYYIYIIMHVPEGTYSKIPPSTGWFITPSSYTGMSQNRYDRLLDEHPSRRDNRVLIHSRTAINPSWIYDPRNVVGIYPGFYTSWFPHHFEVSNLSIFFRVAIYSINPNSCHQLGHRWISPLGWGSNGLQHHLRYLEADLSQRSLNGKVMIYIDSSLDLDGILGLSSGKWAKRYGKPLGETSKLHENALRLYVCVLIYWRIHPTLPQSNMKPKKGHPK